MTMSMKEDFELLRGAAIRELVGDPLSIPVIEVSDAEKLCKYPVVSVHMITYNHEPYIRAAIEGVMMQRTDFEFELVIGEDCSTDKTREICLEFQRRYPDKIRVQWGSENLYRHPTPAGGNGARTLSRCRGEFVAYCEGDDYWTDSLKLQKQVDVMRKNPEVGLCFCGARTLLADGSEKPHDQRCFPAGRIAGEHFLLMMSCGSRPGYRIGNEDFIMTAGVMVRSSVMVEAKRRFRICQWRLALGDSLTWLAIAMLSDVYHLVDEVSVYRVNPNGAMAMGGWRVALDATIVRMFFMSERYALEMDDLYKVFSSRIAANYMYFMPADFKYRCSEARRLLAIAKFRRNMKWWMKVQIWLALIGAQNWRGFRFWAKTFIKDHDTDAEKVLSPIYRRVGLM